MTLSLNEVRDIRFPMARRANDGYRAGEVDEFVDKVYATFTSLNEENERLKAQVGALDADTRVAKDDSAADELRAENERLRKQLDDARREASAAPQAGPDLQSELDRLRRANAELEHREQQARAEVDRLRQQQASRVASGGVERIEVGTSEQASPVVIRLVQLATEQAENLMGEAEAEAAHKRAEAEREAEQTTAAARAEAQRIATRAREDADRMAREAKARADQVDIDATGRREALFTELERERDQFQGKVDRLRAFENDYRARLTQHLRQQADALDKEDFQPGEVPALLGEERGRSATPRLDALLARKN